MKNVGRHSSFIIHHSSFRRRLGRTVAVAVFGWIVLCGRGAGAVGGSLQNSTGSGLKMTVDTRWPARMGYRPVRITVEPASPGKPTTVDRLLSIEFISTAQHYYRSPDTLAVSRDIELPAGFKQVETILSVPQVNPCGSYNVQVWEDGSQQKRLSQGGSGMNSGSQEEIDCLPAILFVGPSPVRTDQLAVVLPSEGISSARAYNEPGSSFGGLHLPTGHSLAAGELPKKWIDYSGIDVICLSLHELAGLKTTNKKALDAIRHWTAAGGNLWVYGIGDNWQGTPELEKLLGLPSGLGEDGRPSADFWRPPDPSLRGKVVGRELMSEEYGLYDAESEAAAPTFEGQMPLVKRPDKVPTLELDAAATKFLLRRYDLGLVAALAAADPLPGRQTDWTLLFNAVGSDRWAWYRRHGMSTSSENPDYTNFLIPGVGSAPVVEFCILITLFVLAIGPLNYWLLRRWKRLHLLVVTIPTAAAAVTLLLFGYALISDGLGTRVRARSVTYLDQQRGHAACWARLSYYSGLAPGGGLTFPDDVAVQPIQYLPQDDVRNYRTMRWQGDQRLVSGWISSRTQVQYLTVRSRPSRRGVKLLRSPNDPTRARVKNELGARIEQLAICGDDGACYWAKGIDDGEIASLQADQEVRKKLQALYKDNKPEVEPGAEYAYYGRNRRYYYGGWNSGSNVSTPTQSSGRLEKSMDALRGLSENNSKILGPRSYIAVVEQSPEVVHGTNSAEEEQSFHVILGTW